MRKELIDEKIREIIEGSLSLSHRKIELNDEMIALGMDSISFVEIVIEIEKEFGIEFEDNMMLVDNFEKVEDFILYVLSELEKKCTGEQ